MAFLVILRFHYMVAISCFLHDYGNMNKFYRMTFVSYGFHGNFISHEFIVFMEVLTFSLAFGSQHKAAATLLSCAV